MPFCYEPRLKKKKTVHNKKMEKLRKVFYFFKDKYDLLSVKRYTTIAGTLVFFLIMSIVPLSFLLTLLIGKLPVDPEQILSLSVFESVKNILLYVQREASNATTGASVVLIVTTLYSATNLFYQMRRSGEIIYDFRRHKKGLKVRLGALVLLGVVMTMVVVFLLLFAFGTFLASRFLSEKWVQVADYILLAALAFLLVLLLNMYVCPYKTSVKSFLLGTTITVLAWVATAIGFSIYMRISNVGRLYGALSTIIVFLLWLYILMICFIAGVIFNSEKITAARKNDRKRKRKNVA